MMNPDRAGLLKQLDEAFWNDMRILGDEAEDAGEEWLAKGWRWLADNKLRPVMHRHGWCGWKVAAGGFLYELPGRVYNRLKGGKPRKTWRRYPSESQALLAAASAAGEYIRDEMERIDGSWEREKQATKQRDLVITAQPVKLPSLTLWPPGLPVHRNGVLAGWAVGIDPVQREVWYVPFLNTPASQARRVSFEELQDDRQNDPLFAAHEATAQEAKR